jgi:orotate phosphoribosyltransferase
MIVKEETALKMAEFLLRIKAIKLNVKDPYTWASGWKSPIYCDNRITLAYPVIRTYIRQQFVNIINEEIGDIDAVVGVATAGLPHGVIVAQDLGLPFAYVRSAAKDHGLNNRIEGIVESGQSVVVVEDLVSTGGSSLSAVKAIQEKGANVKALLSIFTYGFDLADQRFADAKCKAFALSNYQHLLSQAISDGYILEKDLEVLNQWRQDPQNWKKK